ncbi:peptidase M16 [Pseudofulvimonas gallinarii]|nr:peptidase M16 [Pseudofulvimonas gallinarii]
MVASLARADTAIDIPYQTFSLDNGLRVVVHTDRKAPVVAINIWYHVGSKDEQPGRTGFAHLFEHLMFQGTENYNDEFFKPFEMVGATDMNGTTSFDRTNYFANVPTTALDLGLWMASEQMGHFLGSVDQARLDEQRSVVQNEKRQSENQPYGMVWQHLLSSLFPAGHRYAHLPIGSMADLDAATLDDVRWWFRSWYGPNNAVLVLAGDIDLETARTKVTRYFGDIPAGPTMAQPPVDVPARKASTRATLPDRVAQTRLYRAWVTPQFGSRDETHLKLIGEILGGSAASRLDRRLVHQEKLVDMVSAFSGADQLAGTFIIVADIKRGVDPARVEAAIDEEIERLRRRGPDRAELDRARTSIRATFVRAIEHVGGFSGKADVLAQCTVLTGDPGCFRQALARVQGASSRDLRNAARQWLAAGSHTVLVEPGERPAQAEDVVSGDPGELPEVAAADPRYRTVASDVDRSAGPPKVEVFPDLAFPTLQRSRLDNGLAVVLARREGLPLVQMSLEIEGGYSADAGRKPGTASFTMNMLPESAGGRSALELAAAAESLGARIGSGASLDAGNISLSVLHENLAPALTLYADVIRRPGFFVTDIERVRAQWLAGIAQEKTQPGSLAMRLLPPLLYGRDHPYGIPFTGSGDEASIVALQQDDLIAFHRDWVRPDNATLIVVGDIAMDELLPLLEKHLGDWKAPETPRPLLHRGTVPRPSAARVFLVDQPGAVQANILVGQVVPSTADPSSLAFDIGNGVIGGTFTSRLNMNLREDKAWSYGVSTGASNALGQRPWIGYAPVQIDRTAEAITEIRREIAEFTGTRPPSSGEIAHIRTNRVHRLPGSFETGTAVLGAIAAIVRYGRPDDYVTSLRRQILDTSDDQVRAAMSVIDAEALTWVVVGDLATIEAPVRALELGEVTVLDADGRPKTATAE